MNGDICRLGARKSILSVCAKLVCAANRFECTSVYSVDRQNRVKHWI